MKHTKKRVAALLLTLAMVLSLMPMAFAADEYPDMPAEDEASYAAVKSAIDNGIMTGNNGVLDLEGSISRSTVSKMLVVAFAAKGEADLSAYPDVGNGMWYDEWMAKANQMGIMTGTNGKMNPDNEVTLQEVATMLVRALGLPTDKTATLEGVADWAAPFVKALIDAGYIPAEAAADATKPMTRAAFAEVIYKVSGEGNYVSEGEVTESVEGNIVITSDGVTLKDITVNGDVIIADGVDAGSVVLDNVTIKGRLVIRGGEKATLTNGTTADATVVAKTTGEIEVNADTTSDAGAISVAGTNGKSADKVVLDMAEPKVAVNTATDVAIRNATGGEVTMNAAASLAVESGTLDNVTVAVEGAAIDVAAGSTIEMVTTNTDIAITGEGTVTEKEGSGTVTDGSGAEVGGSDEPADIVIPDLPKEDPTAAPAAKPTEVAAVNPATGIPTEQTKPEGSTLTTADGKTVVTTASALDASDHASCTFNGEAVVVAPTCTAPGTSTKTCSEEGCGATQTTYTPATGHSNDAEGDTTYAKAAKVVPANCKGAGYASYSCKVCGLANVKVVDIAILEHSAGEHPTYVTQTVSGTQKHFTKCTMCGEKFGDGAACAPAELDEDAEEGATVYSSISATQHSAPCDTCKAAIVASHEFGEWSTTEGETSRTCSGCGAKEVRLQHVHSWENGVCTNEDGLGTPAEGGEEGTCGATHACAQYDARTGKCTVCGKAHEPHVYTKKQGKCDVCGLVHADHQYADTNSDGKCTVCGFAHTEHAYTTSEKTGQCNICKKVTCTHAQYENGACKACGYEHPDASHTYGTPTAKDAECTVCGKAHTCDNSKDTTVACKVCGWKTEPEAED